MKQIAVFFGGESVEHDVSVITGITTLNALDNDRYEAIPVYVSKDGIFYTGKSLKDIDSFRKTEVKKLDKVAFLPGSNVMYKIKGKKLIAIANVFAVVNCMHGGVGEDGSFAGLMNLCKIPLSAPNVLPSSVSMDKAFTKNVLKSLNVKHLPAFKIKSVYDFHKLDENSIVYPLIIKPNLLGSSIGITKAQNREQVVPAILNALKFCDSAIIEPCLEDFMEINCAAYRKYNGEVILSECERPIGKGEILDFSDKYRDGDREFPARISKSIAEKIKKATLKVYEACDFTGIVRMDFMVKGKDAYLNEINSVPGSLSYYLFCDTLKEFSEILSEIIEKAVKDHAKAKTTVKKFDSGILGGVGTKGTKHLKN